MLQAQYKNLSDVQAVIRNTVRTKLRDQGYEVSGNSDSNTWQAHITPVLQDAKKQLVILECADVPLKSQKYFVRCHTESNRWQAVIELD